MNVRRARGVPIQGAQHGDHNDQRNYFAPVTENLFAGGFERLRDVWFDPAVLARDLGLARFTGCEWLIEQIDDFIGKRPRGSVIVQAEAGVGKSSLAAHLVGTRPWLHHFTRLPGGAPPALPGAPHSHRAPRNSTPTPGGPPTHPGRSGSVTIGPTTGTVTARTAAHRLM